MSHSIRLDARVYPEVRGTRGPGHTPTCPSKVKSSLFLKNKSENLHTAMETVTTEVAALALDTWTSGPSETDMMNGLQESLHKNARRGSIDKEEETIHNFLVMGGACTEDPSRVQC